MSNFSKWFLNGIISLAFWCPIILGASIAAGVAFEEVCFHVLDSGSTDSDEMGPLFGYAFLSVSSSIAALYAAWQAASALIVGAGLLTVPKSPVRIRILWKSQLRFRSVLSRS